MQSHHITTASTHIQNFPLCALLRFHFLHSKPRPRTHLISPVEQRPHPHYAQRRAPCKHPDTPANPQIYIQRAIKRDRSASQRRTTEIIASKQRRSILWIARWDIDEDTMEYNEDTCRVHGNSNDGDSPMDAFA
jgi:hypothetical protein